MTINSKSIAQIVQEVGLAADSAKEFDGKLAKVATEALAEINKIAVVTSSDQLELSALGLRISRLSQLPEGACSSLAFDAPRLFSTNQELGNSLAQGFLLKANLTIDEARAIEAVLLKYPKLRDEIIRDSIFFMNERMAIEERVSILERLGQEKINEVIEAIKKKAAQNGREVSLHIKSIGITDQKALIEIAKIAAVQSGEGVSEYIQNYGITDERARTEIAKIVAAQNGWVISSKIINYEITDQNQLCEIAKIALDQNASGVSFHIKKYGITDQKILIEIAKFCAIQNGWVISRKIQNFGIADERARIEIAKIVAAQSELALGEFIRNYGITDENALIEIAKISAAQRGSEISKYIQNYGITNERALIEIAKIAASHLGEDVCLFFKNYGVVPKSDRIEIAKSALYSSPIQVLDNLSNFELERGTSEYRDLVLRGVLCGFGFAKEEFILFLKSAPEFSSLVIKSHEASIETSAYLSEKKPRELFSSFLGVNDNRLLPEEVWSPSEKEAILGKVASYRNLTIGSELAIQILGQGSHPGFRESYLFFTVDQGKKVKGAKEMAPHKILPSIILAKWLFESKTKDPLISLVEPVLLDLTGFLTRSRGDFKNNFHSLMQTFLLTTLDLDKAEGLSPVRKLELVASVCKEENTLKGLSLIRALLARKEIVALNTLSLEDSMESLKEVFERTLLKDSYVDLSGVDNLVDKYLEAFENTRTPLALETYRAKLQMLPDEGIRDTLNRFVTSVLNETIEEERYDIEKSSHLQKIAQYDLENGTTLLTKWKTLTFSASISPLSEPVQEEVFSLENFFRQKVEDKHGYIRGIDQLPYLSAFFEQADALGSREAVLRELENQIDIKTAIISAAVSAEQKAVIGRDLKLDQLQKGCIELLDPLLSKEDQIEKLKALASLTIGLELTNDLRGLASTLQESPKSSSLEKVVFCSEWEDLFLSGTEVSGSCQRIDGDPEYNKCLLAYCLDGKNSMIAVKGPDGKILARSMLRLLWNKTDSKPVLFLDRFYPDPCIKERIEAIRKAAIECSKNLEIDLFIAKEGLEPSTKVIESLGSSCPFEYADASDGVMRNGLYTLKEISQVL